MGYHTLRECVDDLEATGQLVRIEQEVDPRLEVAEIQRRVYQADGPAIYYANPKGCTFPLVSNLFGTLQRTKFIFRDTLDAVRGLVQLKIDPTLAMSSPLKHLRSVRAAMHMLPRKVRRGAAVAHQTRISELPQIMSWPDDGGAFITLPQVYTEDPDQPGLKNSNLGMYRAQLSGNEYQVDREIGLHYQIHRGIGVHHAAAIRRGEPLRVNIFVGGPPCMAVAAVMPLPEGLSELSFAGALGGRRVPMIVGHSELPIAAEADFCIVGTIDPERQLPEGPFGDHLGYYSLAHNFPVLRVEQVYHRPGAIWPLTVVGRPPQEDTAFGQLIHEITGPLIPTVVPGVRAVHAVDAAGVHPLLLAIGSERYVPYGDCNRPQELITQSNAILGQGQMSLAKYLLIVSHDDNPQLDIDDEAEFFKHLLARIDFQRDLHFQTRTTIDTLDYSGDALNEGSKLVMAAVGAPRRELPTTIDASITLPPDFSDPRVCLPGVLAIKGPEYDSEVRGRAIERFVEHFDASAAINRFPLIVIVDDSEFTARTLNNFLWVTFTRSNPAADIHGIGAFIEQKHWGCRGSLVIDARIKPHHAPPLVEDPNVTRGVDALAVRGGPLHGII